MSVPSSCLTWGAPLRGMTLLFAAMIPILGLGCASSGNTGGSGGTSAAVGQLTKGANVSKEQANKETVTKAYQRTFGDLDTTAVDEFFSKDFVQHNPTIADGPEGVKALVQMLSSQGVPKQKIEFNHVLAEGDVVILHSRYEMAGTEWRFIDIYRVENGKLAEHWDAMMQAPKVRANKNSMF